MEGPRDQDCTALQQASVVEIWSQMSSISKANQDCSQVNHTQSVDLTTNRVLLLNHKQSVAETTNRVLLKHKKAIPLRTDYQGLANTPDRLSGFRITITLRTDYQG